MGLLRDGFPEIITLFADVFTGSLIKCLRFQWNQTEFYLNARTKVPDPEQLFLLMLATLPVGKDAIGQP